MGKDKLSSIDCQATNIKRHEWWATCFWVIAAWGLIYYILILLTD